MESVTIGENGEEEVRYVGSPGILLPMRERWQHWVGEMERKLRVHWAPLFWHLPANSPSRADGEAAPFGGAIDSIAGWLVVLGQPAQTEEESLESVRQRVWKTWVGATSVRSLPAPASDATPCGYGCLECSAVPYCTTCNPKQVLTASVATYGCTCAEPEHQLRCIRCPRVGRSRDAFVVVDLIAMGNQGRHASETPAQRRTRLDLLERKQHVSELLVELGQTAWVAGEESSKFDQKREQRLAGLMQLQGATWGDGSPMVNPSFQVCSFHTLYDHTQYAHGKAAEQD